MNGDSFAEDRPCGGIADNTDVTASFSAESLDEELRCFAETISLHADDVLGHNVVLDMVRDTARKVIDAAVEIQMFGSAASGLCEKGSDVDATILVDFTILNRRFRGVSRMPHLSEIRQLCADAVSCIAKYINNTPGTGLAVEAVISSAKVPIVVLSSFGRQIIDVSINNVLPIYNTRLLREYMLLDERVRILVLCVKRWAKMWHISDAKQGNLSSYSWTLLCIYYLQTCSPPILPSLQNLAIALPQLIAAAQQPQEQPSSDAAATTTTAPAASVTTGGLSSPRRILSALNDDGASSGEVGSDVNASSQQPQRSVANHQQPQQSRPQSAMTASKPFYCPCTGRVFEVSFVTKEEVAKYVLFKTSNTQSISELLRGFFGFYAREYQWGSEVVSIRIGKRYTINGVPIATPNDSSNNRPAMNPTIMYQSLPLGHRAINAVPNADKIHIEDPLDMQRNLHCVMDAAGLLRLRKGFSEIDSKIANAPLSMLLEQAKMLASYTPAPFSNTEPTTLAAHLMSPAADDRQLRHAQHQQHMGLDAGHHNHHSHHGHHHMTGSRSGYRQQQQQQPQRHMQPVPVQQQQQQQQQKPQMPFHHQQQQAYNSSSLTQSMQQAAASRLQNNSHSNTPPPQRPVAASNAPTSPPLPDTANNGLMEQVLKAFEGTAMQPSQRDMLRQLMATITAAQAANAQPHQQPQQPQHQTPSSTNEVNSSSGDSNAVAKLPQRRAPAYPTRGSYKLIYNSTLPTSPSSTVSSVTVDMW